MNFWISSAVAILFSLSLFKTDDLFVMIKFWFTTILAVLVTYRGFNFAFDRYGSNTLTPNQFMFYYTIVISFIVMLSPFVCIVLTRLNQEKIKTNNRLPSKTVVYGNLGEICLLLYFAFHALADVHPTFKSSLILTIPAFIFIFLSLIFMIRSNENTKN